MNSELASILRAIGEGASIEPDRIRDAVAHDPAAGDALVDLSHRIEGLRQRSAELRVMMSSTRELLEQPDAGLMLQRIVDSAHELIDGDVAYLSVYDPAQDQLRVRAASGTISSRFLGMVVPAGVGLASRAVRTRHAQWVVDYAALESVPHDPIIDAIVREEQLRSMLGVPLVVKGEVLGVLFTASRQARGYRPEEISLLTAFAGHAALVLHLARLLASASEAGAEAAFRQQQAEWAAGLHAELTRLAVIGHDADAIAGALSEALGRRVVFVEGPDARRRDLLPPLDDVDQGRGAVLPDGAIEFIAPVIDTTETPGALLVERGANPLTEVERRTVERSALTAALVQLRRGALNDAEDRVRGELAIELLAESTRRDAALPRAAARGYPTDSGWTALAVCCAPERRPRVLSRLRLRADWLAAVDGDGVAVLVPADSDAGSAASVVAQVRDVIGEDTDLIVFGVGASLADAAHSVAGIWQAARLAHGLGAARGEMDATVLAPYAPLFGDDGVKLAQFATQLLEPVLRWDAAKGSDLFRTLVALYDERWSMIAAARSLHVHVNTLKQRAARLRELLGPALDSGEARFRLEMATRIEQVRRELEQT